MARRPKRLNEKHLMAARLKAAGKTHAEIVGELGIDEATLLTWLATPIVKEQIAVLREQAFQVTANHLAHISSSATQTMLNIMNDEKNAATVRLNAASKILDLTLKCREIDLSKEIGELREIVEGLTRSQS